MVNQLLLLPLLLSIAAVFTFDVEVTNQGGFALFCPNGTNETWTKDGVELVQTSGVYPSPYSLIVYAANSTSSGNYICPDKLRSFSVTVRDPETVQVMEGERFSKTYEVVSPASIDQWRVDGESSKANFTETITEGEYDGKMPKNSTINIENVQKENKGRYELFACQAHRPFTNNEAGFPYMSYCSSRAFNLVVIPRNDRSR